MKTESITPEERTKGSDRYREDNQEGDGCECHVAEVRKTMVTGMRDDQQPDDLEAGKVVYVTSVCFYTFTCILESVVSFR
jgi:hypothetical protein